jgi:hypothetical protein
MRSHHQVCHSAGAVARCEDKNTILQISVEILARTVAEIKSFRRYALAFTAKKRVYRLLRRKFAGLLNCCGKNDLARLF